MSTKLKISALPLAAEMAATEATADPTTTPVATPNTLLRVPQAMTTLTGGGGGEEEEAEKLKQWMALKQKYGSSYGAGNALDKRMQWLDWAKNKLPGSDATFSALVDKHASKLGMDKGDMLASMMEEGAGLRFPNKQGMMDDISGGYDNANTKGELKGFPVDGFRPYGLDQIGGRVNEFIQKGYLPKDFATKMKPYLASNERDEKDWASQNVPLLIQKGLLPKDFKFDYKTNMDKVYEAKEKHEKSGGTLPKMKQSANTAAFADDDSAVQAKAAFLAAERDNIQKEIKKRGVTLTPKEQRFFTLVAYNGGAGAATKMLDFYKSKGLLGKDQFAKIKPPEYADAWEHTMPRLAGGDLFNSEEGYFPKAALPVATTTK